MKIRDQLGVPDNLRAYEEKPKGLTRNRDDVRSRKAGIVEFCDTPTGRSSKEICAQFGYQVGAANPMIRELIHRRKLYRSGWRYYKVQKVDKAVQTDLLGLMATQESSDTVEIPDITTLSNEDKLVEMVESFAKDFSWQADHVCMETMKRFVQYIKERR